MKTLYLKPEKRRQVILGAAVEQAVEHGFHSITRLSVANRIGCDPALVNHYFHPVARLRDAVMQHAVENGTLSIIAAGLVLRHPLALAAPVTLRRNAALSLS